MGSPHLPAALLLLCLVQAAAVGGQEDPLSPEERAWVERNGPIRYAAERAYPPFEFVTGNGTVEGINLDLINRMSRNLGVAFEVVLYDNWTLVLDAMEAGEVHMVGAVAPTPEREAYMDFVGPYMEFGEVLYVNADRHDLRDAEDLSGKHVAVVRDYAAAGWLAENHPDMVQVPVPNVLAGLEAVSAGTVDAFFDNIPAGGYHVRRHALSNVRILGEPLYYSPANWAVADGDAVLVGIVRKGLDSIPPGDQTAVFEYWTGHDLGAARTTPGPLFSPVALAVVGGLAATVVAAGTWTWTLRRVVRHRTQALSESRDEVRRANQELESRVRARSRELRLLVERETRLHDELEAEARRVAQSVDQAVDELRGRYHDVLRPATRDLVDAARAAAWDLAALVAAAVETARAGPDGPPAEVHLGPILRREAESVALRRPHPPIVACREDLPAWGEPRSLERLAGHLLALAVALGASAVHAEPAPGGRAVRMVLTGCAGRFEDPAALLEPLRERGLAGLALPAVARIIHRNGGDVGVARDGDDLVVTLRFAP